MLIVDDELTIRIPLARYLESQGFAVEAAAEREEAAALMENVSYDLLILDLRLRAFGGGEGLDLVAEVRRRNRRVPVIVVSAFITGDAESEARRLGVSLLLAKPVPLSEILGAARRLLGEAAR